MTTIVFKLSDLAFAIDYRALSGIGATLHVVHITDRSGGLNMLTDYEQQIVDNVEEHGWFCVSVFGGPGPDFSYSVGFWQTLRAPEMIIFGQPLKLMHSMLWSAFRQIKAGKTVADGERWSNLIEGFDCISRPVHASRLEATHFNSAIWYHKYAGGPAPLSATQLFWPSAKTGLFPWERGCSKEVRDRQPYLYLSKSDGNA